MLLRLLLGRISIASFDDRALSGCMVRVVTLVRISIGLVIFSVLQELRTSLDPMVTARASIEPIQLHEF